MPSFFNKLASRWNSLEVFQSMLLLVQLQKPASLLGSAPTNTPRPIPLRSTVDSMLLDLSSSLNLVRRAAAFYLVLITRSTHIFAYLRRTTTSFRVLSFTGASELGAYFKPLALLALKYLGQTAPPATTAHSPQSPPALTAQAVMPSDNAPQTARSPSYGVAMPSRSIFAFNVHRSHSAAA